MFAPFRKIFNPTIDDKIETLETIITLHKKYIGDCSTCNYHTPSNAPGWVTDYGSCLKNCKHFSGKVCGLEKVECSEYEEESLAWAYEDIEKLKKEKEQSKRTDVFSSFIMLGSRNA